MEKNDGYDMVWPFTTPEFSHPKPSILGACSKDAGAVGSERKPIIEDYLSGF